MNNIQKALMHFADTNPDAPQYGEPNATWRNVARLLFALRKECKFIRTNGGWGGANSPTLWATFHTIDPYIAGASLSHVTALEIRLKRVYVKRGNYSDTVGYELHITNVRLNTLNVVSEQWVIYRGFLPHDSHMVLGFNPEKFFNQARVYRVAE